MRFPFAFALVFGFWPAAASATTAPILALYNVPAGRYSFAKNLGLNSVVIWSNQSELDEAQAEGLRAIVNIPPGNFPDSAAWRARVLELKSHPALTAWILYDEPDLNRKPVDEVAAYYRMIKSLDPVHPVYQTIFSPLQYKEFAPYCDILAVVPYVVVKKEPLTDADYWRVHQFVEIGKHAMKGRPVYAVIQSFAGLPAWPRPPTPKELSSMVAVARAGGAQGFAFYAYTSAEPYPAPPSRFLLMNDTPLMESIKKVARVILKR